MRGALAFAVIVAVCVACWNVGTSTAGKGSTGPGFWSGQQMVNVLRGDVERALRARCYENPWTPYAYPDVRAIPGDRVRAILATWRNRRFIARTRESQCHRIPAWPWLALASCESGRDWDYNGSSGYDGGFQFLPSTWTMAKRHVPRARGYAYAWQAPAYVQYLVARDWLSRTSWLQWPACSRAIGAR